jgi:hypothetical protein
LREDAPGTPLRDEAPFDGTLWAASHASAAQLGTRAGPTVGLTPQSNDGRSPFPTARTPKAISYYTKPAIGADANSEPHSRSCNNSGTSTSVPEAHSEHGDGVETSGVSLDGFIKQHTSEDNEHFKEQQAVSLAAHKKKWWWVYDNDPNHHLRLLSDGQRMSVSHKEERGGGGVFRVFRDGCHLREEYLRAQER